MKIDVRQHFNDEEWATIQRIQKMFDVLGDLTLASVNGGVRGLIVYGPPGVSKTYTVEKILGLETLGSIFSGDGPSYNVIRGFMRTPHLFTELYDNRKPTDVLVIDDCDSALQDQDSLMLLKAALDTTEKRSITYNAQSPLLKQRNIPNTFDFRGSIIFITNTDFKACTTPKLKDHLEAITSRCHYLDISINTDEEKLLWIKYISLSSNMLTKKGIVFEEILMLLEYIETNLDKMNDLSLRAIIKLADLFSINKVLWKETANLTLLSKAA